MLLANGTWTETLSESSAVDAVCAAMAQAVGPAAEALFRPNEFTASRMCAIVFAITPLWRPSLTGKDHQGSLMIATREGERTIRRDELPRLFGLQVHGEPAAVCGKTVSRFLEAYGAAWAWAHGRAERIADLLIGLLGKDTALTLGALRERARGTAEVPGPEWAKPLRQHESPEAAGAKVMARMCADYEVIVDPEGPAARRAPRRAAALRAVTTAQMAVVHRMATAAFRCLAQRDAAQTEGAATAA